MITAGEALLRGAEMLRRAGIENPRREARLLLAHALELEVQDVTLAARVVAPAVCARFEAFLARRVAHEPVAYILGYKEFRSLRFAVGPGVLVPRPETETLLDAAEFFLGDRSAALRVLDLGTGSGCLLVAFLASYPKARGIGADVSPEALAWARRNVAAHELDGRCELIVGDWSLDDPAGFDAVFANPPYIREDERDTLPPDVRHYEPEVALYGGADGLDAYRALGAALPRLLAPGGLAFLEVGAGQSPAVAGLMAEAGLEARLIADLQGIARCAVLSRTQKSLGMAGTSS